ncbi:MAG: Ig-like domain-containing protein [Coriobacteriia bacterium]|nr:Ig-like domain-containing protein [Coriobacteriia bacterium]
MSEPTRKTHWWNKRRSAAAVLAALLILAMLLAGTFAWKSISQKALNQVKETVNPGGRVHDDFDGKNKDVYAENFGSKPIYVRIQLSEYMETGDGAGDATGSGKTATPFQTGATIEDRDNWELHKPSQNDPALCSNADADQFHDYVDWTMGGSKIFMPTFNKDNDSLATDATGIAIDDVTGGQTARGDGSHDYFDDGDQISDYETLNGATQSADEVTHTAKSTLLPQDGGVITVADWIALDRPTGNFWVYDTDGWAYWASALQPGDATSLLLNGINVTMDEDYYYAINVVGQFCTERDLNTFTNPTDDALDLLNKASGLYKLTVTPAVVNVNKGSTQQFSAVLTGYQGAVTGQTITWSVDDPHATGTTISSTGLLTVAGTEAEDTLTIKATALDGTVVGTAIARATDNVTNFTVAPNFCTQPTTDSTVYNIASSDVAQTYNFTTKTTGHGTLVTTGNWSADSANISVAGAANAGTLTIPANAIAGTYEVTVAAAQDSTKLVTFKVIVNSLKNTVAALDAPPTVTGSGATAHAASTFFAGGKEWRVLDNSDMSEVLVLSEHVLSITTPWSLTSTTAGGYMASAIRGTCTDLYKNDMGWAHSYAVLPNTDSTWSLGANETTGQTTCSGNPVPASGEDGCFLLSYRDVFNNGKYGFLASTTADVSRVGTEVTSPGVGTGRFWALRSPLNATNVRGVSSSAGASSDAIAAYPMGFRPALYLNLE